MNKLSAVIRCLVEGNSIRSTVRITGAAKNTVIKLLVDVGTACSVYHDAYARNLPCKRVQVDEAWSYCYSKQKNVPGAKAAPEGAGDVWTWTAICADTKFAASWLVGSRESRYLDAVREPAAQIVDEGQRILKRYRSAARVRSRPLEP